MRATKKVKEWGRKFEAAAVRLPVKSYTTDCAGNDIVSDIHLLTDVASKRATKDTRGMSPRPQNEPNTDTYRGKVGAAIRARREARKLTVAEAIKSLASEGVHVGEKTFYAWESGRNAVPLDNLPALAAILGTTIKKLLPNA